MNNLDAVSELKGTVGAVHNEEFLACEEGHFKTFQSAHTNLHLHLGFPPKRCDHRPIEAQKNFASDLS